MIQPIDKYSNFAPILNCKTNKLNFKRLKK